MPYGDQLLPDVGAVSVRNNLTAQSAKQGGDHPQKLRCNLYKHEPAQGKSSWARRSSAYQNRLAQRQSFAVRFALTQYHRVLPLIIILIVKLI